MSADVFRTALLAEAAAPRTKASNYPEFKAGSGNAHHLVNRTEDIVVYLEIGDRTPGDEVSYPNDDLQARLVGGQWRYTHKDGAPY